MGTTAFDSPTATLAARPLAVQSALGVSQTQSIWITAFLSLVVWLLPTTPDLANASLRAVMWILLYKYAIGWKFLWQPGPTSWFLVSFALFYSSWVYFYIIGVLCFLETTSFLAVCRSYYPVTGFEVDTGCFLFLSASWITIRAFCVRGPFNPKEVPIDLSACTLGPDARLFVFACGLLGAVATLPQLQVVGALAQPLLLLSLFFNAGVAISLLSAPKLGSFYWRFQYLLGLIIVIGLLAFISSGAKGALFLNLFFFAWLFGGLFPDKRFKAFIAVGGVFVVFVIALPAFQKAKDAYTDTKSSAIALQKLGEGITEIASGKLDYSAGRYGKGELESLWEYLGYRLCIANMTQKYLDVYGDRPNGYETIIFAVQNMVPRVIDRDKVSSDVYYNDFARLSGIGGRNDYETSRKPSYIDECVVVWGRWGFPVGGVFFGIYMALVEAFCFRISRNPQSLAVLRYSCLTLGQLPYLAVLFGAIPYTIVFVAFTIGLYLRDLWAVKVIE